MESDVYNSPKRPQNYSKDDPIAQPVKTKASVKFVKYPFQFVTFEETLRTRPTRYEFCRGENSDCLNGERKKAKVLTLKKKPEKRKNEESVVCNNPLSVEIDNMDVHVHKRKKKREVDNKTLTSTPMDEEMRKRKEESDLSRLRMNNSELTLKNPMKKKETDEEMVGVESTSETKKKSKNTKRKTVKDPPSLVKNSEGETKVLRKKKHEDNCLSPKNQKNGEKLDLVGMKLKKRKNERVIVSTPIQRDESGQNEKNNELSPSVKKKRKEHLRKNGEEKENENKMSPLRGRDIGKKICPLTGEVEENCALSFLLSKNSEEKVSAGGDLHLYTKKYSEEETTSSSDEEQEDQTKINEKSCITLPAKHAKKGNTATKAQAEENLANQFEENSESKFLRLRKNNKNIPGNLREKKGKHLSKKKRNEELLPIGDREENVRSLKRDLLTNEKNEEECYADDDLHLHMKKCRIVLSKEKATSSVQHPDDQPENHEESNLIKPQEKRNGENQIEEKGVECSVEKITGGNRQTNETMVEENSLESEDASGEEENSRSRRERSMSSDFSIYSQNLNASEVSWLAKKRRKTVKRKEDKKNEDSSFHDAKAKKVEEIVPQEDCFKNPAGGTSDSAVDNGAEIETQLITSEEKTQNEEINGESSDKDENQLSLEVCKGQMTLEEPTNSSSDKTKNSSLEGVKIIELIEGSLTEETHEKSSNKNQLNSQSEIKNNTIEESSKLGEIVNVSNKVKEIVPQKECLKETDDGSSNEIAVVCEKCRKKLKMKIIFVHFPDQNETPDSSVENGAEIQSQEIVERIERSSVEETHEKSQNEMKNKTTEESYEMQSENVEGKAVCNDEDSEEESTQDSSSEDTSSEESSEEDKSGRLRRLSVTIPWEVPNLHTIETRISTGPTPKQREEIKRLEIQIKSAFFNKVEDEQIKSNWKEFCRLHDLPEDPTLFTDFSRGKISPWLPLLQRIKFARFLAHGLDNRLLYSVYRRFKKIFSNENMKSGRYTKEEDETIRKYMEKTTSKTPYLELGKILNRDRSSVIARTKALKYKVNEQHVKWNKKKIKKFLKYCLKITQNSKIEDLKDKQFSRQEWLQLSKKMKMPVVKLQYAWSGTIHPRIFIKKSVSFTKIKCGVIEILTDRGEDDWKNINWGEIAKSFEGFTPSRLNALFKRMVQVHVPEEKRRSLKDCLDYLNEFNVEKRCRMRVLEKLEINDEDLTNKNKELRFKRTHQL